MLVWRLCILLKLNPNEPSAQCLKVNFGARNSAPAAIRPKNWEISHKAVQPKALLLFITPKIAVPPSSQKKRRRLHALPACIALSCDSAVYFCIFQVFISSEFLSHLNPAPQWGELELLTRMSGRTLKCISPSSVETVWIRLISSLTKLPRRESSLSAR